MTLEESKRLAELLNKANPGSQSPSFYLWCDLVTATRELMRDTVDGFKSFDWDYMVYARYLQEKRSEDSKRIASESSGDSKSTT